MATLYLIPTPLGKQQENLVLPQHTIDVIHRLDRFIVESSRHAQSFLQWIRHPKQPHEMEFRILNKKTPAHEILGFLKLLYSGDTGLFTDAGMPGIADPGAELVGLAHDAGHRVVPLSGPSSIPMALMASGMNGQRFTFHGYLPIDDQRRVTRIRELEAESASHDVTQIFMETPHRNDLLLQALLENCRAETRLCVASNLTMPDEQIISRPVYKWKESEPCAFKGNPALFLINAGKE